MTMNFMFVFLLLLGVSCAIPDNKVCRSAVYHVQTLQQVVIIIRQIGFPFETNAFQTWDWLRADHMHIFRICFTGCLLTEMTQTS